MTPERVGTAVPPSSPRFVVAKIRTKAIFPPLFIPDALLSSQAVEIATTVYTRSAFVPSFDAPPMHRKRTRGCDGTTRRSSITGARPRPKEMTSPVTATAVQLSGLGLCCSSRGAANRRSVSFSLPGSALRSAGVPATPAGWQPGHG
ncbi:unnamed protein product [Ectocarpus sp. 8 AP-2014]